MLAEHSGDVVAQLEIDGTFVWVSPSAVPVMGWDPAAIVGTRDVDWIHPDDRETFSQIAGQARAAREPTRFVIRMRHGDGRHSWVEFVGEHIDAGPEHGPCRVVRIRDVDLEVRAQRQLAERGALLRTVMEDSPVGMVLVDGSTAAVSFVNDSAATMLDRPVAELTGSLLSEVLPDQEPAWLDAAFVAIRSGAEAAIRGRRWLVTSDGGRMAVDLAMAPVLGGSGDPSLVVVQLIDVTAAVESERRIAESERRYRLLAENSGDAVVQGDRDGVIEYVSPAIELLLGWQPEDLLGTRARDLLHPDDAEIVTRSRAQAADHPEGLLAARGRMRRRDGGYRWISSVARLLLDEAGEVTGFVGSWRDVQREVEVEAELEAERQRLTAVLDSSLEPHVYLRAVRDNAGEIVDFVYTDPNPAACAYMGMSRQELAGARVLDLLPGQERSGMLAMYASAVETGEPLVLDDYPYPHEVYQQERRFDIRAVKVGDGLSFAWRDVTERYEDSKALARLAQTDALTGLLNRPKILGQLEAIASHPPRTGTKTAVLFCDLDDLKTVNDTLGHQAGDLLLSTTARRITRLLRSDDLVARFGGDELLIVLVHLRGIDDAGAVAEKIRRAVEIPIRRDDGSDLQCTVSIGVAMLEEADTADDVIARADRAMYEAKRSGRNRVIVA